MLKVSVKEFARLHARSPITIHKYLAQGMPCRRAGRKGFRVEIDPVKADAWLEQRASNARVTIS